MTRQTHARIAGAAFLFYIAVALGGMALSPVGGGGTMAQLLARVAAHQTEMRLAVLCVVVSGFMALVLGWTLYVITSDQGHELAAFAMACRIAEGAIAMLAVPSLGVLWLSRADAATADAAWAQSTAALLLRVGAWKTTAGATMFAVGSTAFAALLLRGSLIPRWLAWTGVIASVLLVVGLPLQIAELLPSVFTSAMWLPMLIFEVALAVRLLVTGITAAA